VRVKECSSCSAAIPESATICDHCGQNVVADSLAVSPFDAAPEPLAPSPAPPPRPGLSPRELAAGVGAALVVALITLALLMARGAPQDAAAAHAEEPARVSAPAAVPPAPIDGVKWSGANVAHWTGKARNSAAFELHAENTVAIWMRQVRPLLVVRCMADSTEAFVITDSALKIELQTDDHTVTFGFDDEPDTKERWQDAADHNAVFAADAASFTQRLTRARTLRFGYTPHNAEPVIAHFHVGGLGPLIDPVAKHCGWTK
jgi:hypothetical protein